MKTSVLISGAGVAGLATAHWLSRFGFRVTLVERAHELRGGGQAVDVRGIALEVLRSMGLYEAVCARRTRLRGMSLVDRNGHELQRDGHRTFSGGPLDNPDIEVFRDDLCTLLAQPLGGKVELRLGQHITALVDDGRHVAVTFSNGEHGRYDLLIGADGIYSQVRRLALDPNDACLRPLGAAMALFTTPNVLRLEDWEWMYREAEFGLVAYPTLDNAELRVGIGFGAEPDLALRNDMVAQKALVLQRSAQLGGAFAEVLAALPDSPRFHYNDLAQVQLQHWSTGRVVLVGDAAHCASPFSGQGTSLALVGAFVLARELARPSSQSIEDSCARYRQRMSTFVSLNQALVDLTRQGPIPDAQMEQAKFGIELADLPAAA